MLFCSQMILTGALMTGAPCLVFGDNTQTSEISQISDHSGEGQIHKPEHLEAPDFTSDPNFIDDSTDNTAGYYTILGTTTVSLDQMTSQYNSHGQEYPSAALKEGGAETIEDFCTIILELSLIHISHSCEGRSPLAHPTGPRGSLLVISIMRGQTGGV